MEEARLLFREKLQTDCYIYLKILWKVMRIDHWAYYYCVFDALKKKTKDAIFFASKLK